MRRDYQILQNSPPPNLLAGSAHGVIHFLTTLYFFFNWKNDDVVMATGYLSLLNERETILLLVFKKYPDVRMRCMIFYTAKLFMSYTAKTKSTKSLTSSSRKS